MDFRRGAGKGLLEYAISGRRTDLVVLFGRRIRTGAPMTPSHLTTWAARWNIPPEALRELVTPADNPDVLPGTSEAAIQTQLRVAASRAGWRLWRNNVGAGTLENGSHVRWGLANDSSRTNASCKSGDLIGVIPVLITQAHVGTTIGQFASVEVKRAGWKYTGTDREKAQKNWIELVNGLGGHAIFSTGLLTEPSKP